MAKRGIKKAAKKIAAKSKKISNSIALSGDELLSKRADDMKHALSKGIKLGHSDDISINVNRGSKIEKEFTDNIIKNGGKSADAIEASTYAGKQKEFAKQELKARELKKKDAQRRAERLKRAKDVNRDGNIIQSNKGSIPATGDIEVPKQEPLKGNAPKYKGSTDGTYLGKHKYDSTDDYRRYIEDRDYTKAQSDLKGGKQNDILDKIKAEEGRMPTMAELENKRIAAIKSASGEDMGFSDYMGFYQVPQRATGIVGTAWLVNNLASTKGQQSNAQLYNQQPY